MSAAPRAERLDTLRATLEELPRAAAAVAERKAADGRPAMGEWSPREVLAHLADAEQVYGVRIRLMVGGDRPRLEAYDQDRWAARFAGLETLETAIDRWRATREATLRLLDSLSEDEWSRAGLHSELGEQRVDDLLTVLAEHDRGHLAQLYELAEE